MRGELSLVTKCKIGEKIGSRGRHETHMHDRGRWKPKFTGHWLLKCDLERLG